MSNFPNSPDSVFTADAPEEEQESLCLTFDSPHPRYMFLLLPTVLGARYCPAWLAGIASGMGDCGPRFLPVAALTQLKQNYDEALQQKTGLVVISESRKS